MILVRNNKGTLYLESNGYVQHCRSRGGAYLAEKFGWSLEEAEEKRKLALKTSNQTVKGLKTLGYDEKNGHTTCNDISWRGEPSVRRQEER
jgi:hypothetical protein